jgi:hypothetical protein
MRALVFMILALALPRLSFAAPEPVTVHIQVIEASKKGDFDKRLAALKTPERDALPGYEGAKLVDEVEAQIEPGASVSLEIMSKSKVLKVTLLKVDPDQTIRLKVAIDAFKFSAETKHQKGKAATGHSMVMVGHPTGKESAVFLAVTPKLKS